MKNASQSNQRRIAVIGGCGHVGLPLGVSFAMRGHRVDLIDTNQRAVDTVKGGNFPFMEVGGEEALKKVVNQSLFPGTSPVPVREADTVIFVTGTIIDEHLNPRISDVLGVIESYIPFIQDGQLIIMRSTVYPGVTDTVTRFFASKGKKVHVAFCPERVAQGYAIEEIHNLPQIVSALDAESEERATELFQILAPEILHLTPLEAELTKLFANSWRYIEFAIANQHYMIAEAAGGDFQRIYHALTFHYPRAKSFAKAGLAAGPCLFKDTMQLSAFYQNNYFLGHAAMLINEGLPNFLVEQLKKKMGDLGGRKIGLLGMAFKANHDDTRESLSYKVKKSLEIHGAEVLHTDVYQPTASQLEWILKSADGFILGVPHREYLNVDLKGKPFVDCWGAWKDKTSRSGAMEKESAQRSRRAS